MLLISRVEKTTAALKTSMTRPMEHLSTLDKSLRAARYLNSCLVYLMVRSYPQLYPWWLLWNRGCVWSGVGLWTCWGFPWLWSGGGALPLLLWVSLGWVPCVAPLPAWGCTWAKWSRPSCYFVAVLFLLFCVPQWLWLYSLSFLENPMGCWEK